MKTFAIILLSCSLMALAAPANAQEPSQSSRSAGKLKLDQSLDLRELLQRRDVVTRPRPTQSEDYASSAEAQKFSGAANRHDQLFEIYEADVELLADLDGDGFHHFINVYFDVDVSFDVSTVYAKLYLSQEGGPWIQYHTTDLFDIEGNLNRDAYEVETELLDGYEPSYYAVLIEIYSLDYPLMVTSEVLDYHYLGRDTPLEDLGWDEPYGDDSDLISVSIGAAGSMSTLLIFFLLVQVAIAARGALALTPLKKSEK